MTDDKITDLAEFELPFGRRAILRQVDFESGLRMVRLVLREGNRITQIDLDEHSAHDLGDALITAAQSPSSDS